MSTIPSRPAAPALARALTSAAARTLTSALTRAAARILTGAAVRAAACAALLVLAGLLAPAPAAAQTVTGPARAIDGDTLEIGGERIRLFGIDAPELAQGCSRDGADWACGRWARARLAARLAGATIVCEGRGRDRYGRLVATCRAGGQDLAGLLVREGAAFAFRRYSDAYVAAEKEALIAGRGIWAGEVEPPAALRAATRAAPDPQAPEGCPIKGNVSASGRVYHLPGQADYAATRIDPARGERWFCSEQEARRAGWRPARR
ncbi:MAG: thermonuclease family protein [Rhodobacteraceae bacterium]|nr:thermonuclease family protein [Paracoccaceae bacterium]